MSLARTRPDVAIPPAPVPLVVDLDGTLLRTDLLFESFLAVLAAAPLAALAALAALWRGRVALKAALAGRVLLDPARLPWRQVVLAQIAAARAAGRKIYLATAADQHLAAQIAAFCGPFDGVLASDGTTNLRGRAKAAALCAAFGPGGFDYIGDSSVDWPVWAQARRPILAGGSARLARRVRARWPQAEILGPRQSLARPLLRALRPHHWLKNLLLLVPLLAGHDLSARGWMNVALGGLAFCLCASGIYLVNDLLDLASDRAHPTKQARPFAAGTLPLAWGLALAPLLVAAALAISLALPAGFGGLLILYVVLTTAYSLAIKRVPILDVVTLACLYGLRVLAGAAAALVPVSIWLGTFALVVFTFLALTKRIAELRARALAAAGDPPGRGYLLADLPLLVALAAASGVASVVVFALYVNSDAVALLYARPQWLGAECIVLLYWVGHMLLRADRATMGEDPLLFAATDRASLLSALAAAAIFLAALS